jgi:hypothetical protein
MPVRLEVAALDGVPDRSIAPAAVVELSGCEQRVLARCEPCEGSFHARQDGDGVRRPLAFARDCTSRRAVACESATGDERSAAGQQEAAGEGAAAGGGDGDFGRAGHLAVAGLAAELEAGLVQEAVAVEAAG